MKDIYSSCIKPQQSHINVGCGEDLKISELAKLIAKTTNYNGDINFDQSKPDGAPRKLMDTSLLNSLGWKHEISLVKGLKDTYKWYLSKMQ